MTGGGSEPWRRPLGALPAGDETVEFRVWAPYAGSVDVLLDDSRHELTDVGSGVFEGRLRARAGDDYWLLLDGERRLADPCSSFQPQGTLGPSRIVDAQAFAWSDGEWVAPVPDELVIYELHVGTFSTEGTFDGAVALLGRLRELGVTAVELMPVASFPGERNWGYDPVFLHAPHHAYGGPEGLARFVDAAHGHDLAVLLDVVYNHLGPGSAVLSELGPYFSRRTRTPWGPALNVDDRDSGAVREWIVQSACRWVRDYHVDGFRLDALWAMADPSSPTHIAAELASRARDAAGRAVLITAEADPLDPRLRGDRLSWGIDLWWADGFHHALHALVTGERGGYYAGLGHVDDLVQAFRRSREPRLAVYAQNHDQVGNRPLGDRLEPAAARLAAFCLLFSPFVPLLFMGEEHAERAPFPFFTDHPDPSHASATRHGRRRALRRQGFDAEPLDPQALDTFTSARLDPAGGDADTRALYRRLIAIRAELPQGDVEARREGEHVLRVQRGAFELVCNFSPEPADTSSAGDVVLIDTGGAVLADGGLRLLPWGAAILQLPA